jgi:glycosyltransferase involved in cell wall biosynthesis
MKRAIRVLELRSVRGTGGGPEKTIVQGTATTDRSRFEITVCYIRDQRDDVFRIDQMARAAGVDYTELLERHSLDRSVWAGLRSLVRSRQIDIVHAHDYKTDLLTYLLAKAEPILPLSTVHGWTGHSSRERYLYYPADKRVLARFPRLIAVSSEIRAELVRCGASADRISVVLNGIDHRRFVRNPELRVSIRRELGAAEDELVVGAVGRLEPQKRFDLLLHTVARLRATRPNIRLFISGEGSARPGLEALLRELKLEGACRLVGHRDDVARLHCAFDLFVQSSDYEGTPNAVLEAMALKTPVVATDAGGTAELIEHGVHGLIVPSNDLNALVGALTSAIDDPEASRTRATAARHRVEDQLSFERRMQRVEAIYDEMVSTRERAQVPH